MNMPLNYFPRCQRCQKMLSNHSRVYCANCQREIYQRSIIETCSKCYRGCKTRVQRLVNWLKSR